MSDDPASPGSLERCYQIKELQALTGLSDRSLRRLFENEPGVIVLAEGKGTAARRRYRTITIPESVVRRVLRLDAKGE